MKPSSALTSMTAIAVSVAGNIHCDDDSFSVGSDIFSNEKTTLFELNVSPKKDDSTKGESIALDSSKYDEWSKPLEKRYDELLVKKYTNRASSGELKEYEELTVARERLLSPMTADEIIAEMNREKAAEDLIKALANYKKYVG